MAKVLRMPAPESSESVVAFKDSARVPTGCTAEGLADELDAIGAIHGVASVEAIKLEVTSRPEFYPNMVAWLPKTDEEAWDIAISEAVRLACRSLVRYKVQIVGGREVKSDPVRMFFSVQDEATGKRGYQRIEMIATNNQRAIELYEGLRAEAQSYQRRAEQVLQEIGLLLRLHVEQ